VNRFTGKGLSLQKEASSMDAFETLYGGIHANPGTMLAMVPWAAITAVARPSLCPLCANQITWCITGARHCHRQFASLSSSMGTAHAMACSA
jgi:hypothetical protein